MKILIVATDFSEAASNAVNYAADLALAIDADLLLLNVYNLAIDYGGVTAGLDVENIQKDTEDALDKLKDFLRKRTGNGVCISTRAIPGRFFDVLTNTCENINPYAVIMGSQGTTSLDHLLFGSRTVYAAKHLRWPLITVPKGSKFSAVKKIGLACDFSEVVKSIPISEIKSMVKDFNASLHILNTGKQEAFDPEIVFQSGLLEEMLLPMKVDYHFITNKDTDAGIIDFVEKNNIDLLITLPKRHSLLDKIAHASHIKQFILHSHVPVMVLHQFSISK